MRDTFGDRMKDYEARETDRRFLPMLPVGVRIDGRSFHTFTRGFEKPFSKELHDTFALTTQELVRQSGAIIGYTQSDEISLILHQENPKSELFFDGKVFKLTSVLASIATAVFNRALGVRHELAIFDCRVWQLPSKQEAINMLLWRESDARRNSVSAAAQAFYSAKALYEKSMTEQQDMLHAVGVNWADYPKWIKTGTYYRRELVSLALTERELASIPADKRPPPGTLVQRARMVEWPYELGKVENKIEAIFDNAPPRLYAE